MPEAMELAQTAGATIVTLMATDAWTRLRDGLVGLWRATQPQNAELVGADLEAGRNDLLAGGEYVDEDLRAEWRSRLRRFLAENPAAAGALRQLLTEVRPSVEAAGARISNQNVNVSAWGRGTSSFVGGNQTTYHYG